jgi:signal peptidase II
MIAIIFGEQKIKDYMEEKKELGKSEEILGGNIILQKYHNSGMFLNFLEEKKEMVLTVSKVFVGIILLLFAITLPRKGNKVFKLGLAMTLGGAISNVMDREKRGYVVDYFSFSKLKKVVFNLSDMFIILGSFLIAVASIFSTKGKRCANEPFE